MVATGIVVELVSPRGLTEVVAAYLFGIAATYFAGNVVAKKYQGGGLTAEAPQQPQIDWAPAVQSLNAIETALNQIDVNSSQRHAVTQESLMGLSEVNKALLQTLSNRE